MTRFNGNCLQRSAFTVVELLTTIAIIGVLAAVALVAVLNSRSTARQLTCKNNFRQIGLATTQFADSKRFYPYCKKNVHVRGLALLLPGLEQEALFQQLENATTSEDVRALKSPPILRCPDELEPNDNQVSYIPCGGETSVNRSKDKTGFYDPECINSSFVPDGLSNTVFFSERLGIGWQWPSDFGMALKRYPVSVHEFVDTVEMFDQVCWKNADSGDVNNILPAGPIATLTFQYGFGTRYVPNSQSCEFANVGLYPPNNDELAQITTYAASSLHGQSVNALLGDGSVKSISRDIDRDIWIAAGTISGKEPAQLW